MDKGMTFQEALLYAIAHPGVSIKPKDTDLSWRFYDPDEDTFFFHINNDDTTPCHIPPAATIDRLWITDEKE